MATTQAHRPASVGTRLGPDVLLVRRLYGTEQIGRLFLFELDLYSENHALKFDDVLGENISIRLSKPDGSERFFNGCVNRFVQTSRHGRYSHYRAEVVPWLWFLTRTADCRIYQNVSVPDIVKEVFRHHGFADFDERLTDSYRQWEYCVQYRETDFNFVSRLLEQEGIYYYFRHENGKHTLVLADSIAAHESFPGYEEIAYRPPTHSFADRETISDWTVEQQVQPGQYALTDFDFKNPTKPLLTSSRMSRRHAMSDFEIFDYPGCYAEHSDGQSTTRARIEEHQVQCKIARGISDAQGICPGFTFALTGHPRDDQCRTYLITSAVYQIESDEFESSESGGSGPLFTCNFTAIENSQPFRPVRITPKPLIQGPQTAIVVGKPGEEIWTDRFGRVKVQFHWDRHGEANENSSCWIRVAQLWAGKKWGAMYIPRIGQEVVVEFLEGDPDRPLVTGRVYNGTELPPYDLPAEATKSTIKSNSSKGGDGSNEIRFEDKKGNEQIFIHAEKDQDVRIKNDSLEYVGNDRHLIVKRDQMEKVEGDKHLTVMGDRNEKIDGAASLQVGMNMQEKVGQNHALDAGMEIHLKAGMNVVLEAGMSITLKAGGGFIVVGPAGVTVSGTPILLNSGGSAGSGSGSSPDPAKEPNEAAKAKAGQSSKGPRKLRPPKPTKYGPSALVRKQAASSGAPFCEKCQAARKALLGPK